MFRFTEDDTLADMAFEAEGRDLAELLAAAARAVTATMVRNPDAIEPRQRRTLAVEAADPERLLHKFLEEIVYYKDAEQLLLGRFDVRVAEAPGGRLRAEGTAEGEPLDAARHQQVVDVKAVTWHRFKVERAPPGWRAFVILDI